MRLTVKIKALSFMVALIVAVSLGYTYESISTEKSIIRSEILKRAEAITSLATKNGELPILSGSQPLLKDMVSFLKATSDISSVTFYTSSMVELIHDGPPVTPLKKALDPNTPVVFTEEDNGFVFYAPIFTLRMQNDADILHDSGSDRSVKEHIGWIRLTFSKASMRDAERNIVERGLLLLLLFTTVSTALVYFLITLAIKPLSRIVAAANQIADGDFSQDVDTHRKDEIGELATAFQRMKSSIQQVLFETTSLARAVKEGKLDRRGNADTFSGEWRKLVDGVNLLSEAFANGALELQEAKGSLEVRVEQRTLELEQTNSVLLEEIAERTRAEEELRHAKEYTENLIQAANVMVVGLDTNGCVTLFNHTAEQITGYTFADLEGKNWFEIITPRERFPEVYEEFERLKDGGMPETFENPIQTKAGEKRIIVWRNNQIFEDGRVVGTLSFGNDITAHRLVEDQLRQSQKMESVGRLAGGVAHDFNNMLSVILGYAQLSMLSLKEGERLWKHCNEISKAAERSSEITRQLLAFSRKEIITPKPLNLNAVIVELQKTLGRLIGEDVNLTFYPAPDIWTVKLDPSQVNQILINMAVNARDAMPDGGNLGIETANVFIDEGYCQYHFEATPGEYVQITVSDNGSGMDKETVEHIFEPFFTTKGVGKGTGLGLATVYGIVTQNNGFINVYSEPREGTSFKLYFPRLEEHAEPATKESNPVPTGSGTVLLAEDDDQVMEMTAGLLEFIGYTVLKARTPHEAIALCRDRNMVIDIILSDVVMPGMNGKEMTVAIQRIRPGLKVLFMSGYTADIVAQKGVVEEGMYFIQKPFNMHTLNKKIEETLRDG